MNWDVKVVQRLDSAWRFEAVAKLDDGLVMNVTGIPNDSGNQTINVEFETSDPYVILAQSGSKGLKIEEVPGLANALRDAALDREVQIA